MNYNNLCPHCMREVEDRQKLVCPYCGYRADKQLQLTHQLKLYTILGGKYLVGDVIGEGGFGITYIGFELNLEMKIAIKEFYPNGFCSREIAVTDKVTSYGGTQAETFDKWRQNFVKEAKSLAKCSHLPGIVGVKDFFQENNTAYIVMEYLEGITLKNYIAGQGGKIPAEQILALIKPIVDSLAQIHKTGLIHRDISPDNIMLTDTGGLKLLDFGAARDFTKEEEKSISVLLKPGYAPEEQYRTRGKQGPWSDVYALAATIYKCITGITPPESMERMRQDTLKKPSECGIKISRNVENALLKAMSVYAENRYQSMEEFYRGLYDNTCVEVLPKKENKPALKKRQYGIAIGLGATFLLALFLIIRGKEDRYSETVSIEEVSLQTENDDTVADDLLDEGDTGSAEKSTAEEIIQEKEVSTYQYEFFYDDVTWYEAYEDCISRGGHLLTIESREEYDILTAQLTEQELQDKIFWIGGMRLSGSRDYYWIDETGTVGDISLNEAEEYRDYWLAGEPSYTGEGVEEQFLMLFYRKDPGKWVWNDAPADLLSVSEYYAERIGYICEY